MDWATLAQFADKFGVPVTLLVLFLYLDIKRRKKEDGERIELANRLNSLEDYQRNRLEGIVVASNEIHREFSQVAERMAAATENISRTQQQLTAAIAQRPCLHTIQQHGAGNF